jgi:hypothetical protein
MRAPFELLQPGASRSLARRWATIGLAYSAAYASSVEVEYVRSTVNSPVLARLREPESLGLGLRSTTSFAIA